MNSFIEFLKFWAAEAIVATVLFCAVFVAFVILAFPRAANDEKGQHHHRSWRCLEGRSNDKDKT